MGACASCRHNTPQRTFPAPDMPLLQIRRGYRARWNQLAISVETDSAQWTLRVKDSTERETLYTAHRGGARAAQLAAAEFAIVRVLGPASTMRADRLTQELEWQEYW